MRKYKGSKGAGLTGLLCVAALFLGTGILAMGTSAFDALAAEVSGQIASCKITDDKQNVEIAFNSSGSTEETDGKVYVFEQPAYEDDLGSRSDYLTSSDATGSTTVTVPFKCNDGSDRLYSKFVLAVKENGAYKAVSEPHYITNPEVVAKNTDAFKEPLTKKGLNIELNMLDDAFDLGVKYVTTNIAVSRLMGSGIDFQYEGKTYHFNKGIVEDYDKIISAYSGKGMVVNAILLNDWSDSTSNLFIPGVEKTSSAYYYMFNATNEAGLNS